MNANAYHNFTLRRRGSVYAMVLGVTMLITVIGIGALATNRVTSRGTDISADWQEAGGVAFSAVEHAVTKLSGEAAVSPAAWRATYTNGAVAFDKPLGRGRMKWVLIDDTDGVLGNDYAQTFKVYGIGQVGRTKRVYSATLLPSGEGLAVLGTTCHSAGELKMLNDVVTFGGPVSSNGNVSGLGHLNYGVAEAAGSGGSAGVSAVKPMPSPTVFELYKSRATVIPTGVIAGGTFAPTGGLTADNNPYGDKNSTGIYFVQMPDTYKTLEISACRTAATLLIAGSPNRTDQEVVLRGAMFLSPHRSYLPTLIIKGVNKVTVEPTVAQFTEGGVSYPSEIRGLVHCIGTTDVTLKDNTYVVGTVVCDGVLTLEGVVGFTVDPRLKAQPPMGYTKGTTVIPAPGSWKWDAPPPGT